MDSRGRLLNGNRFTGTEAVITKVSRIMQVVGSGSRRAVRWPKRSRIKVLAALEADRGFSSHGSPRFGAASFLGGLGGRSSFADPFGGGGGPVFAFVSLAPL